MNLSGRQKINAAFWLLIVALGLHLLWRLNQRPEPVVPVSTPLAPLVSPATPIPAATANPGVTANLAPQTEPPRPGTVAHPREERAERMTPTEFATMLKQTYKDLPRVTELRKLTPEEAHHAPAPIMRAGAALGAIAAQVASQSELTPQAAEFYETCALTDGMSTAVRALCLARWESTGGDSASAEIPQAVRDLAKRLPQKL